MTTYTFEGTAFQMNWSANGKHSTPTEFLGDAELVVTAPDNAEFSYSPRGEDHWADFNIWHEEDYYAAYFTGGSFNHANIDKLYFDPELIVVEWELNGQSYSTTLLHVEFFAKEGAKTSTGYFFTVDGEDLPFTSIESYYDAFDLITSINYPKGDLAPNNLFAWSDLNPTSYTEDDTITYASSGKDRYEGGLGDDYFYSSPGNDYFNGGKGEDTVSFSSSKSGVHVNLQDKVASDGDGGSDKILNVEVIYGSHFDDVIVGDRKDNKFVGRDGSDYFDGKGGWDSIDYRLESWFVSRTAGDPSGVKVDLSKKTVVDTLGNTDTVKNIEWFTGTSDSDWFKGDKKSNYFWGVEGKDRMSGAGGDDFLFAGDDKDVMIGGTGSDQFIFAYGSGKNIIKDFDASEGDLIAFGAHGGIDSYDDLMANHVRETKKAVIITDDELNLTIKVNKVSLDDLTEDAFVF